MRIINKQKYRAHFFKRGCRECDLNCGVYCPYERNNGLYDNCYFLSVIPVIWKKVTPKIPFRFTYDQIKQYKIKFQPQ